MSNKAKIKGTKGETRVVKYLKSKGLDAERLALKGSKDEGDVRVITPKGKEIRIEVKSGEQTMHPTRGHIEEWMEQTITEGKNAELPCVLVIARHRKAVKDYDVYIPWWTFNGRIHQYLDDYVNDLIEYQ